MTTESEQRTRRSAHQNRNIEAIRVKFIRAENSGYSQLTPAEILKKSKEIAEEKGLL